MVENFSGVSGYVPYLVASYVIGISLTLGYGLWLFFDRSKNLKLQVALDADMGSEKSSAIKE